MKKKELYEGITQTILEALEKGTVPWRKPFKTDFSVLPMNFSSGKTYRGINILLLNLVGMQLAYPQNSWLTFNQAKKLGGHIRKEEQGTTILFWKPIRIKDEEANPEKEEENRQRFMARAYRVFNTDQCEGIDLEAGALIPAQPIRLADSVLDEYENAPRILSGSKAAYYPKRDVVRIPQMKDFLSPAHYYSTLFHELVHATGHQSRLNRQGIVSVKSSDRIGYAEEELVAEIGASFLSAMTGIASPELGENTAAYIRGWLKALKDDKQMVIKAASQAQKAVDHILGIGWT